MVDFPCACTGHAAQCQLTGHMAAAHHKCLASRSPHPAADETKPANRLVSYSHSDIVGMSGLKHAADSTSPDVSIGCHVHDYFVLKLSSMSRIHLTETRYYCKLQSTMSRLVRGVTCRSRLLVADLAGAARQEIGSLMPVRPRKFLYMHTSTPTANKHHGSVFGVFNSPSSKASSPAADRALSWAVACSAGHLV